MHPAQVTQACAELLVASLIHSNLTRMARTSVPVQSARDLTFWSLLSFVLRLGGLMPFTAWFALSLLLGAWYAFEIHIARPPMTWMGEPKPTDKLNPFTWTRTLRNHGFLLGYSDLRGNPLWATYALTSTPNEEASQHTVVAFSTDWREINRITPEQYEGSGYERGHLASILSIGQMYGRDGHQDTLRMTNATPQKNGLANKLWMRLEALEVASFAKQFGKIWVMTGPIFEPPLERLHSSWRVEVPDAFFKIIVAPEARKILVLAIPQTVLGDEPLDHYVTSVDAIEKRTGFDFFHDLEDGEENRLEAAIEPETWHLHELAYQSKPQIHKSDTKHTGGDETKPGRRKP
ncbi:MAG: DNA/RNA non-specific endonuclease [Candidatus Methylumidiphilus sp.]